jgi:hypothetical protein
MINRLLALIFSIYVILTPTITYAGAAELWKYEPTLKDMNIKVTGHKVDALGNAVNDAKYTRTIDPKVGAARTAQGTVGMGRLLKTSGWGLLGYAALEGLLNAVGWVIDPASQSIWRNKQSDQPSYGSCYGGKYLFRAGSGQFTTCPMETIEKYWASASKPRIKYEFLRWQATPDDVLIYKTQSRITYVVLSTVDGVKSESPDQSLQYKDNPDYKPDPAPKEVMTPDILSDYVNRTHPDYADPNLAPKLEPKWNPQIAPDLWTPANKFEETNSPTVQIAKKELDNANPTSPDPEVKPNPDTGGMTLPSFCDWASVVCDFVKDFSKEPDNENNELDLDNPVEAEPDSNISFSTACPAKIPLTFNWNGSTLDFSFDFTIWCQSISTFVYPIVVALGSLHALYIVAGVRQDG